MRSPDALERLAAARPALPGFLADAAEEERILARILASGRAPVPSARPRRAGLMLAGVAVLAAAAALAAIEFGHGTRAAIARTHGRHSVTLTGARIQLAGYHFRTPAGFKVSATGCLPPPDPNRPRPALDGFAAAASADGGCVGAAFLVSVSPSSSAARATPAGESVDVGAYQGYFEPAGTSGQSMLYVELPKADRAEPVYLVLYAQGLTEDQLIAVAESGLPTLPPSGPTTTTGTETTG